MVPELGFCLSARAQMFWLDEHHPAGLAPGKRPRTTLSPSLALRDGAPYTAFGTPDDDQRDRGRGRALRRVHFDMNLQEAMDAPGFTPSTRRARLSARRAPGPCRARRPLPAATVEELRQRGHELGLFGDWSLGRVCTTAREGAILKAAANPRLDAELRDQALTPARRRHRACHANRRMFSRAGGASGAAAGATIGVIEQELPLALLDSSARIRGAALLRAHCCAPVDEGARAPAA